MKSLLVERSILCNLVVFAFGTILVLGGCSRGLSWKPDPSLAQLTRACADELDTNMPYPIIEKCSVTETALVKALSDETDNNVEHSDNLKISIVSAAGPLMEVYHTLGRHDEALSQA